MKRLAFLGWLLGSAFIAWGHLRTAAEWKIRNACPRCGKAPTDPLDECDCPASDEEPLSMRPSALASMGVGAGLPPILAVDEEE